MYQCSAFVWFADSFLILAVTGDSEDDGPVKAALERANARPISISKSLEDLASTRKFPFSFLQYALLTFLFKIKSNMF